MHMHAHICVLYKKRPAPVSCLQSTIICIVHVLRARIVCVCVCVCVCVDGSFGTQREVQCIHNG